MTGEITIMGKVLPVGGIHAKIRAAYEAGVKEVILPADNLKEIADLPQYVKDAVKLFPVNSLDQVIAKALLAAPVVAEVAE
jgi:ATP-dependent Lon protease